MPPRLPGLPERIAHRAHALREQLRAHRAAWIGALVQLALVTLLFGPVVRVMVLQTDFGAHLMFAKRWEAALLPPVPHFLFHLLVLIADRVIPWGGVTLAGMVVATAAYQLLGVVLYALAYRALAGCTGSARRGIAAILVSLSLIMVMPVNLLSLVEPGGVHLYLGYLPPTAYHSPTTTLLRPLAVLMFLPAVRVFDSSQGPTQRWGLLIGSAALLTILTTLAKPSYTIALLPALWVYLAYRRLYRRQPVDGGLLVLGFTLPTLVVLAWQYVHFYLQDQSVLKVQSAITVGPLVVMSLYSGWLLPKFWLSILFPGAIVALYAKEARQDRALILAWIAFVFGALLSYLMVETYNGEVTTSFIWCGAITLFVLFVASMRFFLRHAWPAIPADRGREAVSVVPTGWDWRASVVAALYALHVLSGLLWYALIFTPFMPGAPTWYGWM